MRRAAKVDANHAPIVAALRQIGCEVTDLSGVGRGVADLLVSYRGGWHLLEVKDGAKKPSARKLTPDQQEWIARQNARVHVVESIDAALRAVTYGGMTGSFGG